MAHNSAMLSHQSIVCVANTHLELPFDIAELALESEIVNISSPVLSIIEVRTLIKQAYQTPFEKATQTFIIDVTQITFEAQNALLKILEEPPITSRFILIIRPDTTLLPTLRSRLQEIININKAGLTLPAEFINFLQFPICKRMSFIAKITKNKDVMALAVLATGLSLWLSQNSPLLKPILSKQLLWCLSTLKMRGAGKKMLWEEIAFLLPLLNEPSRSLPLTRFN